MNNRKSGSTVISVHPDDFGPISLAEMTLEEVIDIGETDHDRPNRHRRDFAEKDIKWESVRTKVLGFANETRLLAREHGSQQIAFIQRMEGKHGLAIIEDSLRVQEVEAAYEDLSALVNVGKAGDKAVELLEADDRVRYKRGVGSGKKVVRLCCFKWVYGAAGKYCPVLGLSHGQLYLACCLLSLATHPSLTKWGKKAIAEEVESFWTHVEERKGILEGHIHIIRERTRSG